MSFFGVLVGVKMRMTSLSMEMLFATWDLLYHYDWTTSLLADFIRPL